MNSPPLGSSCPKRAHRTGGLSGCCCPVPQCTPRPDPLQHLWQRLAHCRCPSWGCCSSSLCSCPHPITPSCPAQTWPWLLSSPKVFLGAGQGVFLTLSISTVSGRLTGTGPELSARIPAAEQEGWMCQGPSTFLPVRAEHGVWARLGIRRGFTTCAVPGLSSRHQSPELSIWYLSPALKFN